MRLNLNYTLIEETRNKILIKEIELDKQTVHTVSQGEK